MGLSLLAALLVAAPAQAQTDYEIRLFRPNKAGDRYRISVTGHQIRQVMLRSASGETLRSERASFSVEMAGAVQVLEVDPKGNATRAAITVDTLVRVIGLQRDELLRPGTLVTEQRAGARQEFQIDGRVVGPDLKDALDVALSETNDPGAPSDDELMGTRERKKVGERWPVNRERLASFCSQDSDINLAVAPQDIEGGGTLAAVARVGDIDCLRVDVAMTILGRPRDTKLPAGMEKAKIEINISALLPVDPKLDQLEESTRLTMTLVAPASPPLESRAPDQIVTTWEQRSDRKLQPVR